MVYVQKQNRVAPQIKSLTLSDFSGGINNRSNDLALNEASDMLNMQFVDETLIEKRYGSKINTNRNTWDKLNSDGTKLMFVDVYKPYTGDDMNVYITEKYFYDLSTQNADGSYRKFDVPLGTTGKTYMGLYVWCGNDGLYLYGKTPTVSSTYVLVKNFTGEASEITEKTTLKPKVFKLIATPPSGSADYTAPLDSTHTRGVMAYNYQNMTCWYIPCDQEMNDPYLGLSSPPANCKYLEAHNGRMYVAGNTKADDSIYLSQVGNPFYFPAGLGLQLTANSDQIVCLKTYDDGVVVFRHDDIHVIKGVTNNPTLEMDVFSITRLNTHTGCASGRAVSYMYEYLVFLGSDGNVYALSTVDTDDKTLASTLMNVKVDLTKPPFNFKSEQFQNAFSAFTNDGYYLAIDGKVVMYNSKIKAWTLYEGWNPSCFAVLGGKLVWANSSTRHIMTFDETTRTDDGVAYKAHWKSALLNFGDAISYKGFKEFFITKETSDNQNDLLINFEVDTKNIGFYDAKHTVARWQQAQWGDMHIYEGIIAGAPVLIGERGRTMRITLSSGYSDETSIKTVQKEGDLIDVTPKVPNMLVKVEETGYYYSYKIYEWKKEFRELHFNQPIKIHQINLIYEVKGRR